MKAKIIAVSLLLVAFSLPLAACQGFQIQPVTTALTASGTIAADTTRVAPEIGGKILDIKVNKGDTVKAGDVLFTLDSQILQAQHDQAAAAVQVAQAALDGAQQKLATAQAQYNLAVQAAQMQNSQSRANAWQATQPSQFTEPNWYFQKTEQITALQTEIDAAQTALTNEQANLKSELQNASNEDFVAAEKRLAVAEAAYQDASKTLDQAKAAKNSSTTLTDAAQKILDEARQDFIKEWGAGNPLPQAFYFPLSLWRAGDPGVPPEALPALAGVGDFEFPVLHTKCIIADRSLALVTSANLSDSAQKRNLELGVLIKNPSYASKICNYFDGAIKTKVLLPLFA